MFCDIYLDITINCAIAKKWIKHVCTPLNCKRTLWLCTCAFIFGSVRGKNIAPASSLIVVWAPVRLQRRFAFMPRY